MDFNATIDLIIKDLNETRDIIDDLKKYPGVPLLQIELAKSKCKSAGEVIALIKTVKDIVPQESVIPIQPMIHPQPEPEHQPLPRPVSQPVPQHKPQPEPLAKSKPKPKTRIQSPVQSKLSETPIIADNFIQETSSFHDQLRSMEPDNNLSDTLIFKPISNLSEAIGVNDRFLFIREIFNDDSEAYQLAISRLDNVQSIADAQAVIMSYTGDNIENEAAAQLLDLVRRKLSANE